MSRVSAARDTLWVRSSATSTRKRLRSKANRDPRKWTEPNRYNIQRRPSGHMALGSGIHGCVGQAVARLEGEVILTALAKRVKRIDTAGPHTRRLNNTLRALDTLPLRLIPI